MVTVTYLSLTGTAGRMGSVAVPTHGSLRVLRLLTRRLGSPWGSVPGELVKGATGLRG